MSMEYTKSNVFGAGLTTPSKTRSKATDKSSVNANYKSASEPLLHLCTQYATARAHHVDLHKLLRVFTHNQQQEERTNGTCTNGTIRSYNT